MSFLSSGSSFPHCTPIPRTLTPGSCPMCFTFTALDVLNTKASASTHSLSHLLSPWDAENKSGRLNRFSNEYVTQIVKIYCYQEKEVLLPGNFRKDKTKHKTVLVSLLQNSSVPLMGKCVQLNFKSKFM